MGINFKKNKGFTLMELMVAVAILALVLAGLLMTYVSCILLNQTNINLTKASTEAQLILEELEGRSYAEIQSETIGVLDNLEDGTAEIVVDDTKAARKEVVVEVSWIERNRDRNFKLFTVFHE